MSNFKKLKSELKDLYAIRNVNRVVYFHCDHWEPWRSQPGQSIYCQQNVDGVGMYVDACNKIDFARRQTLFYKPNVSHGVLAKGIVEPAGSQKVHADDRIFFADKTAAQTEFAKAALHHVVAGSDHELQIHIHHENFTFNHSHKAPISQEYFGTADSRLHEDERFSLAVKLWLQTLRDESGLPIDKWFFVHGLWALNGSDANVCHLVREIEIMMRHGCLGDFTFPAGRVHVNPRLEVPYFAKPVAKPKGYDLQECEPEFAYGNGAAVAAGKFFIWASEIKHTGGTIDYYASWYRKRLDEMVDIAKEIVMRSFLVDGTLYIRTHAHSLHDSYFFDVRTPIFPHQHPGVQNLYCSLFDAAASAGCAVEFLTASEVYERFVTAEFMPESGRDLVIPGAPSEVEGIVPGPEPERRLVEPTVVVLTEMPLRRSLPKPMFELLSSPVSDGAPLSDTSAVALVVKTEPAPPLRTAAKPDLLRANKKPPTPEKFSNKMSQPVVREWEVANAEACSVTRNRLQALGEVDSGASSFYAVRLERNAIVTKYEIEIVRYLISAPERYDTYFEIGCGAAVLTAILAINGLPAVGIEGDRKRFQLGEAILTSIKQVDETMVSARCEIVFGRFPSILDAVSVAKSIAIVTNVSATMTEEQRLAFIHGLARFRAVIIDVQHFLSARKAPAEQQALIQELAEFGITNPRLLGGMPSYGPFYMFDGLPAKLAEHQERLEPVAAL